MATCHEGLDNRFTKRSELPRERQIKTKNIAIEIENNRNHITWQWCN